MLTVPLVREAGLSHHRNSTPLTSPTRHIGLHHPAHPTFLTLTTIQTYSLTTSLFSIRYHIFGRSLGNRARTITSGRSCDTIPSCPFTQGAQTPTGSIGGCSPTSTFRLAKETSNNPSPQTLKGNLRRASRILLVLKDTPVCSGRVRPSYYKCLFVLILLFG